MISFRQIKKAFHNPVLAILYLFGFTRCYSQLGEDIIIDFLMLKDSNGVEKQYNGFYIDIGGNDPIRATNTRFFYEKGWTGINVEPNKKLIKKFQSSRSKDVNLQVAVGRAEGELTFYSFEVDMVSTCDPKAVERYQEAGHKLVDSYPVPVWTLAKICDMYVKDKQIDLLSVDVEGLDMEVLESNDWNKYRPTYIIVETVENSKNGWIKQNDVFDPYMKSIEYGVVGETGANTIYKNLR